MGTIYHGQAKKPLHNEAWPRERSDRARFLPYAKKPVHTGVRTGLFVVVVFTLKRSFYPTTSAVPPLSFQILHPREIQILWSQTVR